MQNRPPSKRAVHSFTWMTSLRSSILMVGLTSIKNGPPVCSPFDVISAPYSLSSCCRYVQVAIASYFVSLHCIKSCFICHLNASCTSYTLQYAVQQCITLSFALDRDYNGNAQAYQVTDDLKMDCRQILILVSWWYIACSTNVSAGNESLA